MVIISARATLRPGRGRGRGQRAEAGVMMRQQLLLLITDPSHDDENGHSAREGRRGSRGRNEEAEVPVVPRADAGPGPRAVVVEHLN